MYAYIVNIKCKYCKICKLTSISNKDNDTIIAYSKITMF